MIAVSALAAAGALVLAVLFFRERTAASARVRLLMTVSYIIAALLFVVRGIGVWMHPDSIVSAVSVSPAMSLVYLVGFVIILTTSFGMLLMHKERADEALVRQATIDALTGAYNRGPFAEFAERELAARNALARRCR